MLQDDDNMEFYKKLDLERLFVIIVYCFCIVEMHGPG
ncbi:hypothetical protein ACHAXS_006478 [Conticribra weissflogii]